MKKISILLFGIVVTSSSAQVKFNNDSPSSEKKVTLNQAINYEGSKGASEIETVDIKKFKSSKEDQDEFDLLVNSEQEKSKKPVTMESINEMLQSDENDQLSLLLVKNDSYCNMVLKIVGKSAYNIPIPAKGQNAIMVEKGVYQLTGKVCELQYEAQKDLNKNLLVAIKRMED